MNLTSCGKDFDFLKSCRAPSQLFTALLLQPSLRQCSLSSLSVSVNIYDLFTFYLPLFSRYLKNNHTERYLSSVISKITSRKMLFREANFAESCWSPICILNEKLGGFKKGWWNRLFSTLPWAKNFDISGESGNFLIEFSPVQ